MAESKLPITRMNKFVGEEDYNLYSRMAEEYLHSDMNFTLVLFRVDVTKSDIDDVYAEVGTDKFFKSSGI